MLDNLYLGMTLVFQIPNLCAIMAGVILGYFMGAMPGLGPTVGIAIFVPFTFGMDPVTSLVMLIALYMASEYGCAITAVLINAPGTAGSAATALDGYPLALQGKAALALGVSIIASAVAAFIGTILMIFTCVPLTHVALSFGAPETFSLCLFALTVVAGISGKSLLKGLMVTAIGLLLTTVGFDPITGTVRYAFIPDMLEGIPFIPVLIGLFAVSEVFIMFEKSKLGQLIIQKYTGGLPTWQELNSIKISILRGTIIGYLIGIVPGAGSSVASFVAYNEERRASKHPELFGTGRIEAVASVEAANNSAVNGALVPLLTLGIPGSPAAAVLIGAMMIHGLRPGPMLFTDNPEIPYSLYISLFVGTPIMLAVGLLGANLWAKVTLIPRNILAVIVFGFCVLGSYTYGTSMFAVWIAFLFGILGYVLRKFEFSTTPMVLAMVLGPIIERTFRQALLAGGGSYGIFVARPLSLLFLILGILSFASPLIRQYASRKTSRRQEKSGSVE